MTVNALSTGTLEKSAFMSYNTRISSSLNVLSRTKGPKYLLFSHDVLINPSEVVTPLLLIFEPKLLTIGRNDMLGYGTLGKP